jgi:FAD:protein FMN transferase
MSVVKEMFSRKRVLPLLLIVIMIAVWYIREPSELIELKGQTFGTISYTIKYKDSKNRNFKPSIDSLLNVFNDAVSHYRPNSELSRFNRDSVVHFELPYMYPVLVASQQVYEATDGGFNPAVMPLVNAWGFGPEKSLEPDSILIDSLRTFTDFKLVKFSSTKAWKQDNRVQLDFSAVAKGQGVDVVMEFLVAKGIEDVFVEIGGEVNTKGVNAFGDPWRVAILDPASDAINQTYIAVIDLQNKAVATSANNFNYIIKDGIRYSHTLNPYTGYPTENTILSASVIAPNCMIADAYATAFMALGQQKAKEIANEQSEIEVFLVYSLSDGSIETYATSELQNILHQQE